MATLAILGGSLGAFGLAALYAFLDLFADVLNQFARLAATHHRLAIVQYGARHLPEASAQRVALARHVFVNRGRPEIFGLVRSREIMRRGVDAAPRVSALLSLVHLAPEHRLRQIPAAIVPFVSLMAGGAMVSGVSLIPTSGEKRARSWRSWPLAVAPPYTSVSYHTNTAKVWTNRQAYEWILREVPHGSKMAFENSTVPACVIKSITWSRTATRSHWTRGRGTTSDRLLAGLRPYLANPQSYPDK